MSDPSDSLGVSATIPAVFLDDTLDLRDDPESIFAPATRVEARGEATTEMAPEAFQEVRVRHGFFRSRLWVVTTVLFLAAAVTAGFIARRNDQVSTVWRIRSDAYQHQAAQLTTQLADANTKIGQAQQRITTLQALSDSLTSQVTGLNGQVTTLTGQVTSLNDQVTGVQSRLATVANEKAKAQDQATVLARLLSAAGAVASNLSACVDSSFNLTSAVLSAEATGFWGGVSTLTTAVISQCQQAQNANVQLQQILNGG